MTAAISKPSSLRYYQDGPPEDVDLDAWRLDVADDFTGERVSLSYQDLGRLPTESVTRRMVCVCNWSIRQTWTGILVEDVLQLIGRRSGVDAFLRQTSIGTPSKGSYSSTIPLQGSLERRALLVTAIDGEQLTLERGSPIRLMDFGLYGYKCVKGLARLEVTSEYNLGEWEQRAGYPIDGTIQPKRYWACDLRQSLYTANVGEITDH